MGTKFKSNLGFILVSAGCAIGIGNVWKFPYVTGQNGGGVFVLFYLLFLLIMGIPVMMMELSVGRASRASVFSGMKSLEGPKGKWHYHGIVCLIANALLMMYYTTIAGYMFGYFLKFTFGGFKEITTAEQVQTVFSNMQGSPWESGILMAIIVFAGFFVLSFGVQKGLENVSKFMMSALLVIIVVLVIRALSLPGAAEGLKFYLVPNWDQVKEVGLFSIISAAMSQAFFTLSLGIAAIEIFGNYMSRDKSLMSESVTICGLDTFVAICSGLIIFPACFSFNIKPTAGPPLIFITLPNVFINMNGGRFWGAIFFLFMTFASFTTVIAVLENFLAIAKDVFKWERMKTIIIGFFVILIGSLPCAFGFNLLSGFKPEAGGYAILNIEDFLVSNVILPVGCLIFVLFCTSKWGWGYDKFLNESNQGAGLKLTSSPIVKGYLQFGLPVLILVILIQGIVNNFAEVFL